MNQTLKTLNEWPSCRAVTANVVRQSQRQHMHAECRQMKETTVHKGKEFAFTATYSMQMSATMGKWSEMSVNQTYIPDGLQPVPVKPRK